MLIDSVIGKSIGDLTVVIAVVYCQMSSILTAEEIRLNWRVSVSVLVLTKRGFPRL